jgi:hypothetical protein
LEVVAGHFFNHVSITVSTAATIDASTVRLKAFRKTFARVVILAIEGSVGEFVPPHYDVM